MPFDLETYLDFFGLHEKPFELVPDPRFLYLGEPHQEALSRLQYAVATQKGFLLLTGDVGTGKTLLLNVLQQKLNGSFTPLFIKNPRFGPADLYRTLYHGLGFTARYRSKTMFLKDLQEQLARRAAGGKNALLIIDEAQAMSIDLLEEVRLLSNLETPQQKLLTIFLVGQPELRDTLSSPETRALSQRINIQYHITPLDRRNTFGYVHARVKIAGAENPRLFTARALKAIYKHTCGYPRLINILCDNAMISAFVKGKRVIDHRMIHESAEDIGIEEKRCALGDPRLSTGRRKPSLLARIFGRN